MTSLQPKLQYGSSVYPTSRIRYMKVVSSQPSGSSTFTINPTSSQSVQFQIPAATVFYPDKMLISYTINVAAGADANEKAVFFNDTLSIFSQMVFGDNVQNELVNIQEVNNYCKITGRVFTTIDDVKNKDTTDLYCLNTSTTTVNLRAQQYTPVASDTSVNQVGQTAITGAISKNYSELSHIGISNTNKTAAHLQKIIKLSDIPNTFFKTKEPVAFGNMMYLKFQTALSGKIAVNNVQAGYTISYAANPAPPTPPNVTIDIPDCTIQNLQLWIPVEDNAVIVSSVLNKLSQGIPITFPFSTMTSQSFTGSGASNTQAAYTIQHPADQGHTLKWVVWSIMSVPAANSLNKYDIANYNGAKIKSYQSSLNSHPLQNEVLSTELTSGPLDWLYNKEFLKNSTFGSVIGYQMSWIHIDSFCDAEDITNHKDLIGRPMEADVLLGWNSTLAIGAISYNIYCVPTFMRSIVIRSDGIHRV